MKNVLLDTDVVVNWLTQEIETKSNKQLWKAPFEIIRLSEEKKLRGCISLLTLLEIRFLMRRKKRKEKTRIDSDIEKITSLVEVIIPDEICLIRSNTLQMEHELDPFDAILLSTALSTPEITLVSRDKAFLTIASRLCEAIEPEKFLENNI
ncbi:type II toxin-antitoxin system VapC family toxin [Candidatus Omnitrophota bacterium]